MYRSASNHLQIEIVRAPSITDSVADSEDVPRGLLPSLNRLFLKLFIVCQGQLSSEIAVSKVELALTSQRSTLPRTAFQPVIPSFFSLKEWQGIAQEESWKKEAELGTENVPRGCLMGREHESNAQPETGKRDGARNVARSAGVGVAVVSAVSGEVDLSLTESVVYPEAVNRHGAGCAEWRWSMIEMPLREEFPQLMPHGLWRTNKMLNGSRLPKIGSH
ncbi:hypothetical protein EDD85DRAFT_792433 [Armillaria nabsnona]|nr:hypothetical protein EDD85DRAFT_792433 [Armillaria nabsnona]